MNKLFLNCFCILFQAPRGNTVLLGWEAQISKLQDAPTLKCVASSATDRVTAMHGHSTSRPLIASFIRILHRHTITFQGMTVERYQTPLGYLVQ